MSDPIEALEPFYIACDRAVPPVRVDLPQRILSTLGLGFAPFAVAFSVAAVLLAFAGSLSTALPEGPAVFPKTMQSAGLSRADLPTPSSGLKNRTGVRTWRA